MYISHPSKDLNALFTRKPYQGVPPADARFLFVGLDANYDERIESKPIFESILAYHTDAVAFWRKYRVHHPFLLPEYSGAGRLYHRSFVRVGFTPEHAEQVSFVELLHVPTVGRNVLTSDDLAVPHLDFINSAILDGQATHVFLSATVARLMRESGCFPWLRRQVSSSVGPLGILHSDGNKTVYSHLHFSTYGKFARQKAAQALAIRSLIYPEG